MPYYPERRPDPYAEEQKRIAEAAARSKRRRLALVAVFSLLIIYSGIRLAAYGADYYASRQTSQTLYELYEEPTEVPVEATPVPTAVPVTAAPVQGTPVPIPEPTESVFLQPVPYPNNPGWKISERFRKLKKKSSYIIGWLSMDALEEPVALKDNTYFLTHDVYGKKNANGAIFTDSGINLLTRPYTIYLFGHNMKSGNMFGRLKKYKESAYFYRHRIISFDSEYEDGKYAVFAAAEISTEPGDRNYYNLWALDSNRADEREEALQQLLARSFHANLLDVKPDEQLLILVTCDSRETDRLIVAARRLRDGESENNLTFRRY